MTTTASISNQPADQPAEKIHLSGLLWAGPLTILVATVVNVLLQQIAVALLRPDPVFLPLTLFPPIFFTVIGVLGAVIVFAALAMRSSRPISKFKRIALITLLVSLVPDVLMYITGFIPGTTLGNVIVLMLMHVVAWAASVTLLPRLTQA